MEATDNMEDIAAMIMMDEADETDQDDQPEVEAILQDDEDEAEIMDNDDDGEDDEPEQSEAHEEPQRFKVKVDGQEREVTLDELTRSYSGQAYIQKGMQENAAARKDAETAFLQLQEDREAVATLFQQLSSGQLVAAPTPPDPKLSQTDPMGYVRARAEFEQQAQAYHQQRAQIQHVIGQQAQAQEHAQRVYMAEQARELAQRIPELADAEKAGEIRGKLVATGEHYGFSADEVGQVMDHRALLVLHDAMKYRALQAAKPAIAEKAKSARPVVRPGAQRPEGGGKQSAEKARARMHKTGSVDDVAKYLLT